MKNLFNTIKVNSPERNYFDLTHDVKLSGNMGELIPTLLLECMPGDKFHLNSDHMVRFAPMIAPIMHRVDVTTHYFFVPFRLLWENWPEFITDGGTKDPNLPKPVHPFTNIKEVVKWDESKLRLLNYLGIPTNGFTVDDTTDRFINCMPLAAYNMLIKEYYRAQHLEPQYDDPTLSGVVLGDGENYFSGWGLAHRAYEHDYFTSANPWAQRGDEVVIPYNQKDLRVLAPETTVNLTGVEYNVNVPSFSGGTNNPDINPDTQLMAAIGTDPNYADTAPTIRDLRRAEKLQQWLERMAVAGNRYIENILVNFGVKSSDARLQRPEYITGVKAPVIISEVLNTTGINAADQNPQGAMAGHGISVGGGSNGDYYCEEHGYIMAITSVVPKPAYGQGISRLWTKSTPFDYPWPIFANIGEQEIKNKEIYYAGAPSDELTFGYIPRYSEYRWQPSRTAGDFQTTLDFWHCQKIYNAPPSIIDTVRCLPVDSERIFAVDPSGASNSIYFHIVHKIDAFRPLPVFGTPSL